MRYNHLYNENHRKGILSEYIKEGNEMALSNLVGWTKGQTASACGTSCGASDNNSKVTAEAKPASCGSSCGANDK